MTAVDDTTVPRIAPTYRFQWEEAQQCHVLLYPEGMVKLNPSAAEILQLCDGQRSVGQIVGALREKFTEAGPGLARDVDDFLVGAYERGWLK